MSGKGDLFLLAPYFHFHKNVRGVGKRKSLFVVLVLLLYKLVQFYLVASQSNQ